VVILHTVRVVILHTVRVVILHTLYGRVHASF